jgi:hypothetical protein
MAFKVSIGLLLFTLCILGALLCALLPGATGHPFGYILSIPMMIVLFACSGKIFGWASSS